MAHDNLDLSLYLVTDPNIRPAGKSLEDQVRCALEGGVTIVQLRDKNLTPTKELVPLARRLCSLCREYGVKFIVNDRVDIAIASGADGVHIGQDDMNVQSIRQISDKLIIGVSAGNVTEAKKAINDGADYIGIGSVFETGTKSDAGEAIGVNGVSEILEAIKDSKTKTVAIGAINASTARKVMLQCSTIDGQKRLDGIAVVSAIMGAEDAKAAALELKSNVIPAVIESSQESALPTLQSVFEAIKRISVVHPLIHHMTNQVVINDNANATLAVGASPIMSTSMQEVEDLSKVNGALVINMGTLTVADTMIYAIKQNNRHFVPVILDPVGAGATQFRRDAVRRFRREGYFDIIKGNEGEILSLVGHTGSMRGVDSTSTSHEDIKADAVRTLARTEKCIVVMTGKVDYVSDGTYVVALENGHEFMALITGSGCMAASLCGCLAGAVRGKPSTRPNYFVAATAAIILLTIASERAADRADVKGPGTFRSALIDELWSVSTSCAKGQEGWDIIANAKLRIV